MEVIEPVLPVSGWLAGRGGRRVKHCRREIVDAILYVVDNGIKWRALPADFLSWSTVYDHFADWERQDASHVLLDALRERARLTGGQVAPSAGIIDSASVKAAETVGADTRGFDAGTKITGCTRHIAVDIVGLLICVLIPGAEVPDRAAARHLLARLTYHCTARASGTCGPTPATPAPSSTGHARYSGSPSRSSPNLQDRLDSWASTRDYELLPEHHEAIVRWAMIHTANKRLTRD